MSPKIVVLGEKPQGVSWLKMLLNSNLFDIIGGVPRGGNKNSWWGTDEFSVILKQHNISILNRKSLYNLDYDIIWSLMYGYIIEPELIKKANWFGLNLHESPLPKYRGCNGCSHSIIERERQYGTSFQILGEDLDSGGIIDQELFTIYEDETSRELYERTKKVSNIIFRRNIEKVASRSFTVSPIDVSMEPIRKRSSLADMKELVTRDCPPRNIIRAMDFVPFEPAYLKNEKGKTYFFINNSMGRLDHSNVPIVDIPRIGYNTAVQYFTGYKPRSIVVMPEEVYLKTYPIFKPMRPDL
jgi:methionyl-tRNA formyltransferase